MTTTGSAFRLQVKQVFLTYSCPQDLEENPITSKEDLASFLNTPAVDGYAVSREQHENGKHHYHAFLRFKKTTNIRKATHFDFMGVHPNIALVKRTPWKVVSYVCKDGDYVIENLEEPNTRVERLATDKPNKKAKLDASYREALAIAATGDISSAETLIKEADPRTYTLSMANIKKTLETTAAQAKKEKITIHETNWTEKALSIEIETTKPGETYKRVTILVGPAGIGKTELALFLLKRHGCQKPVIVGSFEMLKDMTDYDGVVFDECVTNSPMKGPFQLEIEQQINFVDRTHDRPMRIRYMELNLPAALPRILTTNTLSRCINAAHEGVARRINVVELGSEKLFAIDN